MNDNGPYMIYYVLAIVFVGSALVGIRQPIGKTLKMALAWLAIFAVAFVLFAFRGEFSNLGQRLRAEATGAPIVEGGTVRIPVGEDGHFWVQAKLNGRDVRLMVDSGASVTTISRGTAEDSGVTIGKQRMMVSTANGSTWVHRGRADRLEIGSIERNGLLVNINDQDDTNLLGMNFLSSLSSWRVDGNYLVLQP